MALNINVGVLGHVDSGKTSLSRALSVQASTACFDKNPQSQERGITLDLGFSTFSIMFGDLDENRPTVVSSDLAQKWGSSSVQVTLVDCPGHASLIRTIIGGAQIIDIILLVIDITKGIQTQTAECLVIGQIVCSHLIVVMNKLDMVPETDRAKVVSRLTTRLHKTLESTVFANCPVVAVSAHPGDAEAQQPPQGLHQLVSTLAEFCPVPTRSPNGSFLFSVDHCFGIKGQGTVLTGTVLAGSVKIGESVELPHLKEIRKVKSMQVFKKPVERASQGDRVGICVTQIDPKQIERGLLCAPGSVSTLYAAVIKVNRVQYFKSAIKSKSKFHVSVGHETVMATIQLFAPDAPNLTDFSLDAVYEFVPEITLETEANNTGQYFAFMTFERPIVAPSHSVLIGSKLDSDINLGVCRIAFHGFILHAFITADYAKTDLQRLKIFKTKKRQGVLERVQDPYTLIVNNLFRKETVMDVFLGLAVELSTGEKGVIESSFGQNGKCKVSLKTAVSSEIQSAFSGKKKGDKVNADTKLSPISVTLEFRRFLFDPLKKIAQIK